MKEKKHIDKLFKDRFKNFEVSPSPEVWGSIQTSMESRKKNRKIIPLFWKVGGVAALLALLFTISDSIYKTTSPDSQVVTTNNTIEKEEVFNEKTSPINSNFKENIKAVTETAITKITTETKHPDTKNGKILNREPAQKRADVSSNEAVVSFDSFDKTPLAKTQNKNQVIANVQSNFVRKNQKETEKAINESELTIKKEHGIINDAKNNATASATRELDDNNNDGKKSILDAINEQNDIKSDVDVGLEKKYIANRWEVAPNFAPVYYNTLSEGSSIDPSFSDNVQNGDVNFSYGVQVSYAVNKRLSIRSGISNVDLSYSTGGIEIGSGPLSSALTSINYDNTQNTLTVLDEGGIEAQNNANGGFGNITEKSTNGPAELIQSITYYEIPLELKYALLNSKVGINVIGGLSTMFLGNNDISVEAGDFSSILGEANNLTSVSFTTNIGIGLDYKVSKKIKFNVEPMFKYQLNPYTDSSVNFKPYYLGIYSGLSFKF
jgi:hypothetical protein